MTLQDNFKAYCDGELSIAERDQVTKHLESNEADRKTVEDLRRLSKSIREYVTQPAPAGLEQTLAALEKAKPRARQRTAFVHQLRWVGAVAAVVLLIGFFKSMSLGGGSADSSGPNYAMTPSAGENEKAAAHLPATVSAAKARSGEGWPLETLAPPVAGAAKGMPSMDAESRTGRGRSGFGATDGAIRSDNGVPSAELAPMPHSSSRVAPIVQKNASLTVKVKSVADAQQNIEDVVAHHGGWVQQSNRDEAEGQTGTATLAVRVPVSQFDLVLKSIRALGDVVSDSSSGNDVTGDVVDMNARLKVLRAEEADYMVILSRARRLGEIVALRDKLTEIRTEIESITSQRNVTKDMAAFSTINVTLEQKPTIGQTPKLDGQDTWMNDTWATAVNGLSAAGKLFAQLFIFLLVWAPIWLPTALLGAWVYRKLKW